MLCRETYADTLKHFVRIACVPETGLLDVESRFLHDSVADDPDPAGQKERDAYLAQSGFTTRAAYNLLVYLAESVM
jgi:hypothetical protein